MVQKRYQQIYSILKSRIQQGTYLVGSRLPSENELCKSYKITRTTARRALQDLLNEGFIEKRQGKGSIVKERRQTLGILTVKGFSEAMGQNVKTTMLQNPKMVDWPKRLPFPATPNELSNGCIYFERLRGVDDQAVMLERNWFGASGLNRFLEEKFIDDSFFKTLSSKYFIEITGSEQEIRSLLADSKTAKLLNIEPGAPILQISIKFSTSNENLNIYSYLYCNTDKYPIGNIYRHSS